MAATLPVHVAPVGRASVRLGKQGHPVFSANFTMEIPIAELLEAVALFQTAQAQQYHLQQSTNRNNPLQIANQESEVRSQELVPVAKAEPVKNMSPDSFQGGPPEQPIQITKTLSEHVQMGIVLNMEISRCEPGRGWPIIEVSSGWARQNDLRENDELVTVNGTSVVDMSKDQVKDEIANRRPVVFVFVRFPSRSSRARSNLVAQPAARPDDLNEAAKFSQPASAMPVTLDTAAPVAQCEELRRPWPGGASAGPTDTNLTSVQDDTGSAVVATGSVVQPESGAVTAEAYATAGLVPAQPPEEEDQKHTGSRGDEDEQKQGAGTTDDHPNVASDNLSNTGSSWSSA